MNTPVTCPHEPEVLGARDRSEFLNLHVQGCSSCREAIRLAEEMRQMARRHIATPPPDPDVIWTMARLSKPPRRWTPEVRSGIAGLLTSALLTVWLWPAIASYLTRIVPNTAANVNILLTSCVAAAVIAAVAAKSIRRMTGE